MVQRWAWRLPRQLASFRRSLCTEESQEAWHHLLPPGASFQILRHETDGRGGGSLLFQAGDPRRPGRLMRAETVIIPRHVRPWEQKCVDAAGAPACRGRGCLVPASAPATALELAWVEAVAAHAARQVEAAAWCSHSGRAYRQKIRFLASSLKRPECHAVLQQVLNGQVSAFELVSWPEEDFLGEARREQRAKHRAEAMSEVLLKDHALDLFDPHLTCPRCKHSGCSYAVLRDSWALPRAGGNMGHMRRDTGKCILAQCSVCSERWQQDGIV
ncbi:unnamed protein product [Effrenium voratum]|nr:unnamed protein product [Effrenium voratum]